MYDKFKKIGKILLTLCLVVFMVNIIPVSAEAATKKPTKITLKSTYQTVDINGTVKVSVKSVKPSGASKSVTYKSSNTKIATVSSSGVVTGKKAGTVTITATSKVNKKIKATIKIKVKDIRPTSMTLNTTKVEGYKGATKTITATVKPANSNQKVTYSSSDKSVATVTSAGKITLKNPGTATITVKTSQKNTKGSYVTKKVKVTCLKTFSGSYVISAAKLKAKMDAGEAIKIVDTRGISKSKTTIKGAITMKWQQISKSTITDGTASGEAGFARTLSAEEMSTALSALGLGINDEIILVSDAHASSGWGDDGRVAFQLLQCGYTNVKILDGGISAMKKTCGSKWANYSQTGPSTAKKKTVTITAVDQDMNSVTTETLLSWYQTGKDMKVIDVRADEEYEGQILYGEVSGGHLKDAIHIRFTDLFRSDNRLKSVAELTAMFEAAGIEKDDTIVTYCTGGIRSGYMQLVLKMCGFENSYNYTESAYRWSNTESAGTGDYWVK